MNYSQPSLGHFILSLKCWQKIYCYFSDSSKSNILVTVSKSSQELRNKKKLKTFIIQWLQHIISDNNEHSVGNQFMAAYTAFFLIQSYFSESTRNCVTRRQLFWTGRLEKKNPQHLIHLCFVGISRNMNAGICFHRVILTAVTASFLLFASKVTS